MSARKSKERQEKKMARLQAGKLLAAVTPAPTKEDIARQMIQHIEAVIADVRNLLAQADRILVRNRCRGLLAGLSSK